jgi:hypothetical protein
VSTLDLRNPDVLAQVIATAKLGRERKAAQQDTCVVFAEALYDTLHHYGIACRLYAAACHISSGRTPDWSHAVVKISDVYFDSLGVFNEATVRAHCKIHPKVEFRLDLRQDAPDYEEEFDELRAFYKAELGKAIGTLARSCSVWQAEVAPPLPHLEPLLSIKSRSRKASRP